MRELFEKYELLDEVKPSRKQVRADKAAVMSQIESEKPIHIGRSRRLRAPIAAAAAAATALTVGTVSVGASCNWDLGNLARSWFGVQDNNSKNISDVLNKLTNVTVTNYENSFDELDFSFLGAVSDDIMTTLFVEVTRNDGGIFDGAKYSVDVPEEAKDYYDEENLYNYQNNFKPRFQLEQDAWLISKINDREYRDPFGFFISEMDDGDPTDNRLIFTMSCDTDKLAEKASDGSVDIEFGVRSLTRDREYVKGIRKVDDPKYGIAFSIGTERTDTIDGPLSARMNVSLNTDKTIKVQPNVDVDIMTYPMTSDPAKLIDTPRTFRLSSLSVSSTALSYRIERDKQFKSEDIHCCLQLGMGNDENNKPYPKINLRDGSSLQLGTEDRRSGYISYADGWVQDITFTLGEVIDLDNIKSIEIADVTIPLNN